MNTRWSRPTCCIALVAVCFVSRPAVAQSDKKPSKPIVNADRAKALDPELQAAIQNAPTQEKWPNSDYARILDLGNVTVQSDGTIVAEYRESYRLFNERARDLAEVSLPFNSSYQSIQIVRARTIKKDGTVVNVKPDDIRESEPFSDYLMYDDAKAVGFSLPAIEDGCIIDYTYKMITRPVLMPGQFWTYWGFSGIEPVGLCRYVLHTPADKPLRYKVYNDEALKPVVETSKDGRTKTYTWEMKDISPIQPEPAMPHISDVRVWMEVSSIDNWQDIAKWFRGLQEPQTKVTPAIRKTVADLIANKTTDDEKARVIYDWVANRTRYVGLEFGISAYKPHAAAEVHDKMYGDCKDKANLLITMLGLAGIKAHPVLLQAGDKRPVEPGLPTLTAFNHCIALADVGSKKVWLDATAETCAYGDIPEGDRGAQALVVSDNGGSFETIPTYNSEENGLDAKLDVKLQPDGAAAIACEITMRGASAQSMRASVRSLSPDKRKEMMQMMAQQFAPSGTLKDYILPDGTDKNGQFVMKLTLTTSSFAKKTGSLLLLPIAIGGRERRGNPYIKEKRVYPIVERDASSANSVTTFTLPEGYAIEDLPDNVNLTFPLQEFHRVYTKSADGKTVTITEKVVERPGTVPANDYPKVKTYYDEIIKTADDQIVLKKTAGK